MSMKDVPYYYPVIFDTDSNGGFHFNPNNLPIDKEKLWKAKNELERFLRETTDSEIYLHNMEVEKNYPKQV